MKIPFNKLYVTGHEVEYMLKSLRSGSVAGDGDYNTKVIDLLEYRFKDSKVMTTTSGTHALELAMLLIDIKPGDEVIMPSYTFPSTANAVMLRGGIPVFVDIEEQTLTMNLSEVEKKITHNTKAIVPVHYGGIGCEMDKIMELSEKYNIYIVEDAAQVLGSTYEEKPLGTFGHIGCFSFHGTKNFVSGEGGAIAIQSEDAFLLDRADILRQKGTNRTEFMKGEVDQYTWVDIGSSYAPSDVLMAFLYAQLVEMEHIIEKRKAIVEWYVSSLQKYIDIGILRSMTNVPCNFKSNYHNFYITLHSQKVRDMIIKQLGREDIQGTIHFVPLHSSPMGLSLGYKPQDLPVTQKVGSTLLRLPLYTDMNKEEAEYVTEKLSEILEKIS